MPFTMYYHVSMNGMSTHSTIYYHSMISVRKLARPLPKGDGYKCDILSARHVLCTACSGKIPDE